MKTGEMSSFWLADTLLCMVTGIMTDTPTKPLAGRSIQLGTPCGSGTYVREFVSSFHNSASVLIECGAKIDWAEMPFCADLGLARSKIFGNFLRSQHDTLVWIDADQGWQPYDIVRLLLTGKDFVGAAGPKKKWPIEFAYNNCDEDGNPLPFTYDQETGLMECSDVGLAFMAISKECAQKIADAYQDLKFPGDGGLDEYAVFDSFIIGNGSKRRRLSEDYAFCRRWTRIGGKIYLMPDIHLTHTGTHVWDGALIQSLQGTHVNEAKTQTS